MPNHSPYRALAFDLDGTLLVGEQLPPANRDALRAVRDAGYRIIIATARWKEAALAIAAQAGVEDPVIACSGAQVHDPGLGADVFDERLPAEFAQALYALCNQERCIATVTVGERVWIKLDGEPDPALIPPPMRWTPRLELSGNDLPRIAAVQGSRVGARIRGELQERFSDKVNVFDSVGPTGKVILTITAKNATKGAALHAACAHLGIPPSAAVAFGDAENDLALFAAAGAAVAMGQASAEVKAAATYVSRPHDQGGVAHAIEILLERGRLP